MTDHAWVASFTTIEVSHGKYMSCALAETDIQALSKIRHDLRHGEPLGADAFPGQMWNQKAKPIKQLPQIFMGCVYWVLGAKAAEVFRQFDVGGGGLYPVEVFQNDRKTRIEGDYFCLCFGNKKSALIWDQSPGIKPIKPDRTEYWSLNPVPADDSIVLSSAALAGPDIWIDPALWLAFFVSDGLAQALKAAKVDGPFSLTRCMVV
ncbi:MAG TPA: hypothetical protein VK485_07835 [Sphingomicrobium sp.]|nr:hypothetical protein [Sphingomicrobium sp.]